MTGSERESLILAHMPQVRLIATRIWRKVPASVALDDLISYGVLGLIDAVDQYKGTLGSKLKTYAEYKIRGAILDSLRRLDWALREDRRCSKSLAETRTKLEQELQRTPTEDEMAAALHITVDEYRSWAANVNGLLLASLDSCSRTAEGRDSLRCLAVEPEAWPSCRFEREQLTALIGKALGELPEIERQTLELHIWGERPLREVAVNIGLGEARISQLKSQAVRRLRAYVAARWPQSGGDPRCGRRPIGGEDTKRKFKHAA